MGRGTKLQQFFRRGDAAPRAQLDTAAPGFFVRHLEPIDGKHCFELGDRTASLVLVRPLALALPVAVFA